MHCLYKSKDVPNKYFNENVNTYTSLFPKRNATNISHPKNISNTTNITQFLECSIRSLRSRNYSRPLIVAQMCNKQFSIFPIYHSAN